MFLSHSESSIFHESIMKNCQTKKSNVDLGDDEIYGGFLVLPMFNVTFLFNMHVNYIHLEYSVWDQTNTMIDCACIMYTVNSNSKENL